MTYVATSPEQQPPKGQGIFSAFHAPGHIKAKAQVLTDWPYIGNEFGGRGAPAKVRRLLQLVSNNQPDSRASGRRRATGRDANTTSCAQCAKGTSIPDYTKVWAGMPPKSPVTLKPAVVLAFCYILEWWF